MALIKSEGISHFRLAGKQATFSSVGSKWRRKPRAGKSERRRRPIQAVVAATPPRLNTRCQATWEELL